MCSRFFNMWIYFVCVIVVGVLEKRMKWEWASAKSKSDWTSESERMYNRTTCVYEMNQMHVFTMKAEMQEITPPKSFHQSINHTKRSISNVCVRLFSSLVRQCRCYRGHHLFLPFFFVSLQFISNGKHVATHTMLLSRQPMNHSELLSKKIRSKTKKKWFFVFVFREKKKHVNSMFVASLKVIVCMNNCKMSMIDWCIKNSINYRSTHKRMDDIFGFRRVESVSNLKRAAASRRRRRRGWWWWKHINYLMALNRKSNLNIFCVCVRVWGSKFSEWINEWFEK